MLCMDFMIVPLAADTIALFTGGITAFGVDIFAEVRILVVLAAVIALEVVVPALNAVGVSSAVIMDVLAARVFGVTRGIGVGVLSGADANTCVSMMTAWEFILVFLSSEEALLFW